MPDGTQSLNPGGFQLPDGYNPLHDPRVKRVTDELHSQIAILNKGMEEAKPVIDEWKKSQEEKKTMGQRLEDLTRKNQELEEWQKETVKKALVQTKVTHKVNELAMMGTQILSQFVPFEQLYQFDDVNGEAFSKALNDILSQAFVDQSIAFKTVNQSIKPPFPTQTPGVGGQPQVIQGSLAQSDYAAYKQVFGQDTVIRQV